MPPSIHTSICLAHGLDDGGQCGDGRGRAVELAAAVVADDERVGTACHRQARVFRRP
jgi:hypothetical protein